MAVKKGILDNFLKPSSHYVDNQKNLRSIFIDKNEDDLKAEPKNFLEASLTGERIGTQQEHNRNTIGTQESNIYQKNDNKNKVENFIGTQQEHNKDTTGTHKEHIKNTIGTQQEHKIRIRNTIGTQLEHGKEHTKEHIRNTIGTQQEHIKNTRYGLSYLSGIQKQLLTLFYLSCKKTRSHITEEFSLINVANTLNIRLGSIKTSLRRLEEKSFLKPVQFKKGRGGWTKFELPDLTYRELLENEKEHNWNTIGTQQEHNRDTYRNTERNTNPSSSSSNLKTTTTQEEKLLLDGWSFDIIPYEKFGFRSSHLKQIAQLDIIKAADVEQSLIEFNYDFENNLLPPIRTGKINLLMGLFRGGNAYLSENYKNEQEAAVKLMADRAKNKREKMLEDEFTVWEDLLNDEDRKQVINKMPAHLQISFKVKGLNDLEVKKWFLNYFINQRSQ